MNIQFPKTPYIQVIFSMRTNHHASNAGLYDEYDICKKKLDLKTYVYKLPEHLQGEVNPGDFVLVHCQTGYQPCEVVEIDALTSFDDATIQPVVCKLDINSYVQAVEQQKRLDVMRRQIEREKQRLEQMVTYDLIAEKSPEFKAMLDAFREAGGHL